MRRLPVAEPVPGWMVFYVGRLKARTVVPGVRRLVSARHSLSLLPHRGTVNPAYVYDIETENWTTFVLGALYDGKEVEIYDHTREREFVTRLLGLKGEVYAHNGGRFDHLWLLDAAGRYGLTRQAKVIANGGGIIRMQYRNGPQFLDSFRIFPMSLKVLSNGTKDNLSELCACGLNCGGYCAIRRDMDTRTRQRVTGYLEEDCRSLWRSLDYFGAFAARAGLSIALTIGGTAWQSASKELGLEKEPFHSATTWRYVRQAYYGGRVEVFKRQSPAGWQYDVNSMYPAKIAQTALPVNLKGNEYGYRARQAFDQGIPGVYECEVYVPDMPIPPLPLRVDKPYRRLFYPSGRFSGIWTLAELLYAESVGARIERIRRAITFSDSRVIFTPWVERLFGLRAKYGKESREGQWLKWIMNSLTGKFGSKIDLKQIMVDPESVSVCHCPNNGLPCACGAYVPVGNSARVFERSVERIGSCAHVEWAAYLTSQARIELHKQLCAQGGTDAVYCDTDGIHAECERTENIGDRVGEWKFEGEYTQFYALAPKVYTYQRGGKTKVRAKGIPHPDWQKLVRGEPCRFESMAGLRNAVNGAFFVRQARFRRVTPNTGGRVPQGPIDTRAPTVDEVYDMCRSARDPLKVATDLD
jgi:hypothetical protein